MRFQCSLKQNKWQIFACPQLPAHPYEGGPILGFRRSVHLFSMKQLDSPTPPQPPPSLGLDSRANAGATAFVRATSDPRVKPEGRKEGRITGSASLPKTHCMSSPRKRGPIPGFRRSVHLFSLKQLDSPTPPHPPPSLGLDPRATAGATDFVREQLTLGSSPRETRWVQVTAVWNHHAQSNSRLEPPAPKQLPPAMPAELVP